MKHIFASARICSLSTALSLSIIFRLERRALTSRGAQLGLADADAAVRLPEGARVDVLDDEADELLIVTRSEIRHVRFDR